MNATIAKFVNWMNSTPWVTSLTIHCGWGALALLVLLSKFPAVPVLAGFVVVTALKEYYWDKHFETPSQSFKDSSIDFGGYQLGLVIAVALKHWGV